MSKNWVSKNWKRWLIIVICLGLLAVHLIGPRIQFDAATIWLIAIATFFLIIPDPSILIPYVKRIKLWEAEIELKEEVKELSREVDKIQKSVADEFGQEVSNNVVQDIDDILSETSKNPRAALLLLSAKIETQIRRRLQEAKLITSSRLVSANQGIQIGVRAGIFPEDIMPAFRDFWAVRNKVAHEEAFDVEDSTILSLVSLGTVLLSVLSTEKQKEMKQTDNNINSGAS